MVQSKISKISGKTATDISDFFDQLLMGREAEVHNVLMSTWNMHLSDCNVGCLWKLINTSAIQIHLHPNSCEQIPTA